MPYHQMMVVLIPLSKFKNPKFLCLEFFESRLDSVLYRSKLSFSMSNARQLIAHKHVKVNGCVSEIEKMKPSWKQKNEREDVTISQNHQMGAKQKLREGIVARRHSGISTQASVAVIQIF